MAERTLKEIEATGVGWCGEAEFCRVFDRIAALEFENAELKLRLKEYADTTAEHHKSEKAAWAENAELKKDFTVSEDVRMVRERQLKRVMNQRDRLQRRLEEATEILENEFDIYDSGCHCFKDWTCRRCEARAWLEEVE